MHESQSLFCEKQIGRNPAFWEFVWPVAKQYLGDHHFEGWELPDIINHVLSVQRGLIRVDADEVSYPLHVILRYELEKDLITGKLMPRDVPEAWDAKMREYLGLSTIDDPANGPMQDVHWPSGAVGYFPSYTLGALMAAQQFEAILRHNPDVERDMARGDLAPLNAWRRKHVWERASFASTPEILQAATGEPLSARPFIAHLQRRYG